MTLANDLLTVITEIEEEFTTTPWMSQSILLIHDIIELKPNLVLLIAGDRSFPSFLSQLKFWKLHQLVLSYERQRRCTIKATLES
jgi:hypothetical protein